VINETLARYYFRGDNPVGKRFGWGENSGVYEIVGVVKDARYRQIREQTPRMIYFPALQTGSYLSTIVIRTLGSPAQLAAAVRRELAAIDTNLPIQDVATLTQLVDDTIIQERLVANLSGFFGVLALALASFGRNMV